MPRPFVALGLALFTGCAYVGDPLPPALNIPEPVTDLQARQQGDEIVISFTIPPVTTDGLTLKLGAVDLRISTSPPGPVATSEWAADAESVRVPASEPGPIALREPAGKWIGRSVFLALRIASHKKKWSAWSAPVILEVVPPLEPPRLATLESDPRGVRLAWEPQPDASGYRIWRRAGDRAELAEAATVEQVEWIDAAARPGDTYTYALQALRRTSTGLAESVLSPPRSISPADRFPPSPPTSVAAIQGIDGVELTWARSPEDDVAGYRVYRSVDGSEALPVGDLITGLGFSDRSPQEGQRILYSVSAVDAAGNESPRSNPVEVVVR